MKKIIRKSLLVLLSLCMIISLPSCEEKEEIHDEAWYAKQIYIDRIAVEHTDSLDDGFKLKIVVGENSEKNIEAIFIHGAYYDSKGNIIKNDNTDNSYVFLSIDDCEYNKNSLNKIHNQKISIEYENTLLKLHQDLKDKYKYKNSLKDIDKFRINKIYIVYHRGETEEDSDYLLIENNELNYVISQNVYNNDYIEYTSDIEKIQIETTNI